MTASLGVAMGYGQSEDAGMLISAADEALYRAKKAGRNRVETSTGKV
jgi:two-component system, cell cycle response regulator